MLHVMDLMKYDHCRARTTDGMREFDDAVVVGHGTNVTIREYQEGRSVFQDHLTDATSEMFRGRVTITGTSSYLIDEIDVAPDQAKVTYEVTDWKRCETCP